MPKSKYHLVEKNEHEILMDEFFVDKNKKENQESIFDYKSISDYNSIFKYRSSNSKMISSNAINFETKPLEGAELMITYLIIGFFYTAMILLMPFSLFFCLKKVGEHERIVVYRLGRIKSPVYKPGYCFILPIIDNYERLTIVQKEFTLSNLQILNHENAIIDTTTQIRYQIIDVIKVTNTLQDLNTSLKSISRGIMVSFLSKKDATKIEREKNFLTQEIKEKINEMVQKWGVTVINLDLTLNSIARDENADNEDPALKSITSVFKSLFSPSSDTTTVMPGTSASISGPGTPNPLTQMLPPELLSLFQSYTPIVVQGNNLENLTEEQKALIGNLGVNNNNSVITQENNAVFSPHKLLQLITPHLNEHLVKEIQTVYEFHIKMKKKEGNNSTGNYPQEDNQIFFLDLKNVSKGQAGTGNSIFSKADCIIKLSEEDLFDLLSDNLKPFTAYMSGRIEIDGDLQDVMKLKKLIKSITAVLPKK